MRRNSEARGRKSEGKGEERVGYERSVGQGLKDGVEALSEGRKEEYRTTEFAVALYELKKQLFMYEKRAILKSMGVKWVRDTLKLVQEMSAKVRSNGWRYYIAQSYQRAFHQSEKRMRLVLGGNRSGNTVAGVWEACCFALGYNPYKPDFFIPTPSQVVIASKTSKTMKMYVNDYVFSFLPRKQIKQVTHAKGDILDFIEMHNGSRLTFMSYDQGRERFQGFSANAIHWDEEPPEDIYHECMMRLVDTQGYGWMTMTPLLGLTWVYHELYLNPEADKEMEVFEWSIEDNACLDQADVERVLSKFPEEVRSARAKGRFLGMAGIVYPWFTQDKAYCEPFKIPDDWQRVRIIDPSSSGITACLWGAIDPYNNLWFYREYYEKDRNISSHCDFIRAMSREESYAIDIIDSQAMESNREIGKSVYQIYVDNLYQGKQKNVLALARKDVVPGIETVWEYCRSAEKYVSHMEPVHPYVRVFKTLHNFRSEARKYRWQEKQSGAEKGVRYDKPVHKHCHLLDCIRYACHYGLTYVKIDRSQVSPMWKKWRFRDKVTGYY